MEFSSLLLESHANTLARSVHEGLHPPSYVTAINRPHLTIISAYFWPEKTGISQVTWELASYLAAHDVEVDVVTAMPFYPAWKIEAEYRGRLWSEETVDGVHIRRSWHHVAPSPSTITRLLHEATLALFALPNLVRSLRHADHAYVITPQLTFAFVAGLLAQAMRVPFTLVVQDVMPDAAVELGMLKNRFMIALSNSMAKHLYESACEIQTLSEGMRMRIARRCSQGHKIILVPNTVDGDELAPPSPESNEFRRNFLGPGAFAVVHTGNMGRKQDLDLLLAAASDLKDDVTIKFFVFGDGADRDRFLSRRDKLGLTNVFHYPLQDRKMLPHVLAGADVLLVSQLPQVTDLVVPSKLQTAMAAGAAIVVAADEASEAAAIITRSQGGIRIPASDAGELVRVIRAVKLGTEPMHDRRKNARTFAIAHYGRPAVMEKLLNRIRKSVHLGRAGNRRQRAIK